MNAEAVKISQVKVNRANPRLITDVKFRKLIDSVLILPKMLTLRPIIVDNTFIALGGNMRLRALNAIEKMSEDDLVARLSSLKGFASKTDGEKDTLIDFWKRWKDNPTVEVVKANELSDAEQREFIIKDNASFGEWDYDVLANGWNNKELNEWGLDVWDPEKTSFGGLDSGVTASNISDIESIGIDFSIDETRNTPKSEGEAKIGLTERFIIPPFSVFDTRQGYWQNRKTLWKSLIKDNGESRKKTLFKNAPLLFPRLYAKSQKERERLGVSFEEYIEKYVPKEKLQEMKKSAIAKGVSLLDPVLAEVACRWFGLENCKTFDCFAGDTVFGYVSAYLGNEFTGIELRPEQATYNNERVEGMNARYICDDGQNVANHIEVNSQDLLFSCPPYFDLEQYSDLPNDASNQKSYEDFIKILDNAFTNAVGCLKENRFAVIVISDIRNKNNGGEYYDFNGDIKRIFTKAGMKLYNEIIIVNPIGSGALRANIGMKNRKIVKTHQNALVFYKGNISEIKNIYKPIEYEGKNLESFGMDQGDEPEEFEGEY